ncbi:MAG: MFS transporter [Gemmatimonadaceae bacterium]
MTGRQRWTLAAVCVSTALLLVNVAAPNVALAAIARDLDASFTDLQWVLSGYALVLAVFQLTAGSLADLFGRKRLFVGGLCLFSTASGLCALAPSAGALIGARALQGLGAAIVFPSSLGLLAQEFEGAERGRALGLLCFAGGTAVLTLAMGWGRAAYVPTVGMPDRYALFAAPSLCASFFVWLLYAPPVASRAAQAGLLVVALAVLPGNAREGLSWRDWYVSGAESVERDVAAGVPRLELARRHREFLLHWNEGMLAERIAMLRQAGIGPLARVRER